MKIKLTVDRYEGEKVVLKTEDNQTVVWPKNKLPEEINEGAVLIFEINHSSVAEKENKELAKEILNEILNLEEKTD